MKQAGEKERAIKGGTYGTLPRAVFIFSAVMLVMRCAESFITPILPLYARVLDASIPLFVVGIVTGINRLGQVLIGPIVGSWIDRFGQRWPFLIGVMVASIACILGGIAVSSFDLGAYRLLSGIGFAMLTIAALAYFNRITTAENRATAMSLLSASTLAGAAIGPLPGGYIAQAFSTVLTGYRATFLAGGILQILLGLVVFFAIRWGSTQGAVAQQIAKTTYTAVLRNRSILTTCVGTLLFGIEHGAFLYFTIPLLGKDLGFTSAQTGWVISGFGVGHVLGALVSGPASDRVERRKPFIFAALFLPGLLILPFIFLKTPLPMVLMTFLIGVVTAPCCGIVPAFLAELAPQAAATAMGLGRSAEMLGIFLGPVIGGALIASFGYTPAIIAYAIITALGGLVFFAWAKEQGRQVAMTAAKPAVRGEVSVHSEDASATNPK